MFKKKANTKKALLNTISTDWIEDLMVHQCLYNWTKWKSFLKN